MQATMSNNKPNTAFIFFSEKNWTLNLLKFGCEQMFLKPTNSLWVFLKLTGNDWGAPFWDGLFCISWHRYFFFYFLFERTILSKNKELNRLPVKRNRCSSPSIVGRPAPHWSKMKEEVDLNHFGGPPWNLLDHFRRNDLLRSKKSQKSREISHLFI